MDAELLDARAGVADFPTGRIRRRCRQSLRRKVVGVRDAAIEIELREQALEVVVEVFQAVEESALHIADRVRFVRIVASDIGRDRPKGREIRAGNAGIGVELRQASVEFIDTLLDLIVKVVLVVPAILKSPERSLGHVLSLSFLNERPGTAKGCPTRSRASQFRFLVR